MTRSCSHNVVVLQRGEGTYLLRQFTKSTRVQRGIISSKALVPTVSWVTNWDINLQSTWSSVLCTRVCILHTSRNVYLPPLLFGPCSSVFDPISDWNYFDNIFVEVSTVLHTHFCSSFADLYFSLLFYLHMLTVCLNRISVTVFKVQK